MAEKKFDNSFLIREVISKLCILKSIIPGRWVEFNCPHCVANGQPRPDTRKRGAIMDKGDGSFFVKCFNCGFKGGWIPGRKLSNKMKSYLKSCGFNDTEIKSLNFKTWQINQTMEPEEIQQTFEYFNPLFKEMDLPKGAKPFSWWLSDPKPPAAFMEVFDYLYNRSPTILSGWDYYWTPHVYKDETLTLPDMQNRFIIPFYWHGKIVGFQTRSCRPDPKYKYIGRIPPNYLFNAEQLSSERDYIVVVEGALDAIGIDCISSLGSTLSNDQIRWLKNSNKKIIVVPDHDDAGKKLIEPAIANGWYVSFPWQHWDGGIKDVADAVKRHGKIWTLQSILNTITDSELEINIKSRML